MKKMCIAGFLALIMFLMPLTTTVGESAISNLITQEQKEENLMIELTNEELDRFYKSFQNLFKGDLRSSLTVKRVIDNAVTTDRDGDTKLDLERVANDLTPILQNELSRNSGSGAMYVSGQQQAVGSSTLYGSDDDPLENYTRFLWKLIRPIIISLTGIDWPTWRYDNDDYDGDGPVLEGETDETKYDNPTGNEKYDYQGLDDGMDWNHLQAVLVLIVPIGLATFFCLLTLVFV